MNIKIDKDAAKIIQQKSDEVHSSFSHQDFVNHYVLETLDSFAFRYFDEPLKAEMVANNIMKVEAFEKGIKEAIKIKNPELRAGIAELVKRVSKAEGPTILREIRVNLKRGTDHAGTCQLTARISFGHPDHDFSKGTFISNSQTFSFEDEIHFRNILAKYLEICSEIFT
jgi:hypothetical protein